MRNGAYWLLRNLPIPFFLLTLHELSLSTMVQMQNFGYETLSTLGLESSLFSLVALVYIIVFSLWLLYKSCRGSVIDRARAQYAQR